MSIRYEVENRSMNLRAVVTELKGFRITCFMVALRHMRNDDLLERYLFDTLDEAKTAADRAVKGWVD